MKQHLPRSRKQSGIALIALLVLTVLAAGYAFYRSTNIGTGRIQDQARSKLLLQLTQAKEALISYAVIDEKKPGRLLCPDLLGNGIPPLLARDDCEEYGGWLPWKTLDLTNASDSYGSNFRYHLSPLFGGDKTTPALNSDTSTSLHLDTPSTAPGNDIVAIIIATRGSLDPRNADGDNYFYNGNSDSPDDNDLIIAVTRQELMAAVEQRIANEVRTCLEQHAKSPDNLQQTYPWPAPLSNTTFKGTTLSLFGMLPDTQPGNPETALKDSTKALSDTQKTLNSASTAAIELSTIYQLQEQAAYARAIYDRLFLAALELESKAVLAKSAFETLDNKIIAATGDLSTYTSQSGSLPAAIETALPTLTALQEALDNNGFDLFLVELQTQNPKLKSRIDAATTNPDASAFDKLIAPINLFKNSLLENSSTPNLEIETPISTAYTAAVNAAAAVNLARPPPSVVVANEALSKATDLYNANLLIETAILSNRINIDPEEISYRATRLNAALAELAGTAGTQALISTLASTQILVSSLSTASARINAAKSATLTILNSALSTANSASNQTLVRTNTESAITQLNALATTLATTHDNVALETLKSVSNSFGIATQNMPSTLTGGRGLRIPVKAVLYWAEIAANQSTDLARLARKGISTQGDSNTSAYTAARKLLASLDGETGTIALLEKSIDSPSATTSRAAQEALSTTKNLLSDLINVATKLDSALETSLAKAAFPTVWYGSACSFIKPPTGGKNWWSTNNWNSLFFYQISARIRPEKGSLTVNGIGDYRSIVLAAGKALCQPDAINPSKCKLDAAGKPVYWDRSIRENSRFLEGKNQDTTRNGDAKSPVTQFSSGTVSPMFNDRLAY